MTDSRSVFEFGDFELDEARRELRRAGIAVELQLRPFQLLSYLVRHRERPVPKNELFDQVWSGTVVSDAALSSALRDVRRALGDDGRRQAWIQTLRGRGHRFVAPVRVRTVSATQIDVSGSPLAGRSDVMARLDAALEDVCRGQGRLVLLAGEAGIGKTRLAQEIARHGEARGLRTVWGRCWEGAGAPPFWPWIRILRAVLADDPSATSARELARKSPWLDLLLPELQGDSLQFDGASSPDTRFLLYAAVVDVLRTVAENEPLILVLDDLHLADAASLGLLRFFGSEIAESRLLVVGTCRDDGLPEGHPLISVLPSLLRGRGVERIVIGGLSEEETLDLTTDRVEHEPDTGFARALYERTRGNPFFIEETLRHLRESLPEDAREGPWTRDLQFGSIGIPSAVRHLLTERIAWLSDGCQELVRIASIFGREFARDVLENVERLGERSVAELLDEATSAGVISEEERAPGTYHFVHSLIRDALYEEIPPARRRDAHRAVAGALEECHGADAYPPLEALAHHFAEAGMPASAEKALAYFVRAARRSLEGLAHEEAAAQFKRALQLQERVSSGDTKLRSELLLGLGDAQQWGEQPREAYETFGRAAEIARAVDAPEALARSALGLESARWVSGARGPEAHVPLLEEALAALGQRDLALRARLEARLAYALSLIDVTRGEDVSRQAVETGRHSGDPNALGYALGARHYALSAPHRLKERLNLADEMLRISRDPVVVYLAHEWGFLDALRMGDLGAAEEALDGAESAGKRHRVPWRRSLARSYAGMLKALQGCLDEAEQIALRESAEGKRLKSETPIAHATGLLFAVRHHQGRLREMLPSSETLRGSPELSVQRLARLLACAESGRETEAREAFGKLARSGFPLPPGPNEAFCLGLLVEICWRLRDVDAAELLLKQVSVHLPQNLVGPGGFMGSSHYSAGLLACLIGRQDEAVRHLGESLSVLGGIRARPWIARAEAAQARALLRRGAPGDAAAAAGLRDQALATAKELGMAGLAASVGP